MQNLLFFFIVAVTLILLTAMGFSQKNIMFIVRFNAPSPGTATATLYSMTGQRVAVFNKDAVACKNSIRFQASDYAAGVYHIGVEPNGRTEYMKMIIH